MRQLIIAAALVALALLAGLFWQASQLSSLGDRLTQTAKLVESAPWASSLSTLQQDQAASAAANASALAAVKEAVDSATATIDALRKQTDASSAALSSLEQTVAALGAGDGGEALKASIAALETGLKDLKAQVESGNAGDAGVASAIAALTGEVDNLKTRTGALDQAVAAQAQAASSMQAALSSLPPQAAIDAAVAELRGALSDKSSTADLTTLNGRVDNLQTGLDSVAASLASLPPPTDLTPLTARVAAIETTLAGVADKESVNTLTARFATLEGAQDTGLRADLDAISTEVKTLGSDVAALGQRLGTAEGGLAQRADAAALAQLTTRLDALETRLSAESGAPAAALEQAVTALRSEIDALAAKVAQAASKDDIAALDLRMKSAVTPMLTPPAVLAQVFYDDGEITPNGDSDATLATLAAQLKANPQKVTIVGFTDSRGRAELNRALSLRRAMVVRRALIGLGVDPGLLTDVNGMGEDAPPVQTADETSEAGNRVVQIYGTR